MLGTKNGIWCSIWCVNIIVIYDTMRRTYRTCTYDIYVSSDEGT